ncbi:hypothetical protein M5D96_009820 [Drosophila gunungcola]|uniref:Uncharacterized protein n=1 Tax=Drosophila gunungcola TaxID=103775 RepID=A0A9P9YJ01_9MUSC|nr:hypothetical protein M5D96_009820 [Drosophila gunungcola]
MLKFQTVFYSFFWLKLKFSSPSSGLKSVLHSTWVTASLLFLGKCTPCRTNMSHFTKAPGMTGSLGPLLTSDLGLLSSTNCQSTHKATPLQVPGL